MHIYMCVCFLGMCFVCVVCVWVYVCKCVCVYVKWRVYPRQAPPPSLLLFSIPHVKTKVFILYKNSGDLKPKYFSIFYMKYRSIYTFS